MKHLLIKLILLSLVSLGACAQKDTIGYTQKNNRYYFDKILKKNIYTTPTFKPEYKGGEHMFITDLINNIDIPVEEIHNIFWEEGVNTLLCKLIINDNGSILSMEIITNKDKIYCPKLDKLKKNIIRSAKKLPKWKPAQHNGKNVLYSTYFEIRQSAFKMPDSIMGKKYDE